MSSAAARGKVISAAVEGKSSLEQHAFIASERLDPVLGSTYYKMLAGKELVDIDSLVVERSVPHGHVEAILTMMRRLEIPSLLDAEPSRQRDLVVAMIAQRIV